MNSLEQMVLETGISARVLLADALRLGLRRLSKQWGVHEFDRFVRRSDAAGKGFSYQASVSSEENLHAEMAVDILGHQKVDFACWAWRHFHEKWRVEREKVRARVKKRQLDRYRSDDLEADALDDARPDADLDDFSDDS